MMITPSSPHALCSAVPLKSHKRSSRDSYRGRRSSYTEQHYTPSSLPCETYIPFPEHELIPGPSRRLTRQPHLLPKQPTSPFPTPTPAIPLSYNQNNLRNQDVLRGPLRAPIRPPSNTQSTSQHVLSTHSSESPTQVFSQPTPSNHALVATTSSPKDSHPVYLTDHDLRTAFRLPTFLPRPPQPISRSSRPASVDPFDFKTLSSNYLNMLANKPESTVTADGLEPVVSMESIEAVLRAVGAPTQAPATSTPYTSPAFSMADDFMTSPFDTPLDDFLSTPLFEDNDMMTSPIIDYLQTDDTFANDPLFGDMPLDLDTFAEKPATALPLVPFPPDLSAFTPPTPLYQTLPSLPPSAQAAVPTASPATSTPELSPAREVVPLPRRRSNATGTRKGVTPQSLLSVDAPIQKRNYVLPSSTSRKEVPALFRKRQRAQAFGPDAPEVDEDDLPPLPPNATQKEQIEWKRKQNTLAARKSRKRKLEYQQELEGKIALLTEERDTWKTRAQTLQAMLQAQGIDAPAFPE